MKIENYKIENYHIAGFTLIEILLYTAIFAVVGGLMVGILLTVTQVQQRESAGAEVTGQLNFIMQTVQRLVSKSSNIEIEPGIATSTLKLRMEDPAKDPTCLSLVNGVVKLAEGPGANPNDCKTTTSDLTNSRVIVNTFNFKKFTQYPGHDTVSIDLTITYNTANPKGQVQRTLSSAIARVSAATFDSNLLPGSATFEIGQAGSPWQNLYLSGVLNLGTAASDPAGQNGSIYYNTASSTFRGYKAGAWSELGSALWVTLGNNIYNTNSGNVGIGTTNPQQRLSIIGTPNLTTTEWVIGVKQNGNPNTTDPFGTGIKLLQGASTEFNKWSGIAAVSESTYANTSGLALYADEAEKVRITGAGKVGIGTTNPSYKLEVNGSIVGKFEPGDVFLAGFATTTKGNSSSYGKAKETSIGQGGSLRVKFDLVCGAGCSDKFSTCVRSYGRIYKNGTPVGTERSTTGSSWTTFSEDITGLLPGDLLQLYVKGDFDSTWYSVCYGNFYLYSNPIPSATVTQY